MKRRIGLLTSGGDCPGLNAAIRGVAYAAFGMFDEVELVGISDGYRGLIEGHGKEMSRSEFSGILNLGGTILGTSRQAFRNMRVVENNLDKVSEMKNNYKKMKLDCLVILGGNGTHKSANMLAQEGLNVIALPKTIDNDIWGTDVTFGFHTAVDTATDVVDKIHTTAHSHGRTMVIEIMGHKVGWLALYAGLAGGADIVLLPEIPYHLDSIIKALDRRVRNAKFSIIAIAEGAREASDTKDEIKTFRNQNLSVSQRLAAKLEDSTGFETRAVIPGHIQRGGNPSPYDRLLSTRFGVHAAELIRDELYGQSIALKGDKVIHNPLSEVAGKIKYVPRDSQILADARNIGICFGD